MEDVDNLDFLCDDSINDSETSFCDSEPDNTPQSITIDISNGSPLNDDNFLVLHYNINSITAEGRLDELNLITSTLNVDFTQLIDIPTRTTSDSISLIDFIFVSSTDQVQNHGTLPRIADHDGVFVDFICSGKKSKTSFKTVYD